MTEKVQIVQVVQVVQIDSGNLERLERFEHLERLEPTAFFAPFAAKLFFSDSCCDPPFSGHTGADRKRRAVRHPTG